MRFEVGTVILILQGNKDKDELAKSLRLSEPVLLPIKGS